MDRGAGIDQELHDARQRPGTAGDDNVARRIVEIHRIGYRDALSDRKFEGKTDGAAARAYILCVSGLRWIRDDASDRQPGWRSWAGPPSIERAVPRRVTSMQRSELTRRGQVAEYASGGASPSQGSERGVRNSWE